MWRYGPLVASTMSLEIPSAVGFQNGGTDFGGVASRRETTRKIAGGRAGRVRHARHAVAQTARGQSRYPAPPAPS